MSVPEVEKTYLQLDAVVLTGVTAEYTSQNATSKEYVDTSITLGQRSFKWCWSCI